MTWTDWILPLYALLKTLPDFQDNTLFVLNRSECALNIPE